MLNKKKSQVWVETVIYTLIGLAVIGILLAVIRPVIYEKQDQIVIDNSITMLNNIDNTIEDVRYYGIGNSYPIEVKIKKGQLKIDSANNLIEFYTRSKYKYSEPGQNIAVGRINVTTTSQGKEYDVYLRLHYSNLNITYNGKNQEKIFTQAPTPYELVIVNNGKINEFVNIDIK